MGTQRQQYEQWFAKRRGPRHIEDERASLEAADAYDEICRSGKLSQPLVKILLNAVESPRALVWNCGVDLLKKLMKTWPEIALEILQVQKNSSSTVRFNAMCCVDDSMPRQTATEMIEMGLGDKSGRVRWKAAQQAEWLNVSDAIPLLTQAVEAEKNAKVRASLQHSLRLLKDGYILDKQVDGTYSLWLRVRDGHSGRSVTKSELDAKGIDTIIREFRDDRA